MWLRGPDLQVDRRTSSVMRIGKGHKHACYFENTYDSDVYGVGL